MCELSRILDHYPKSRPSLPDKYSEVYREIYIANREGLNIGTKISTRLEKWMHNQVVKDGGTFPLLEIGAGNLNHVKFEAEEGHYDIVEPQRYLFENNPLVGRIRDRCEDLDDVAPARRYARIISVATLEHITDLPVMLSKIALLLEKDGIVSAGVPSEGQFLWNWCWRFGTGPFFRHQFGLSYQTFMEHEHVNTVEEMECLFRHLFADVRIRRFPGRWFPSSIYTYIGARKPNREIAKELLIRFRD